MKLGLKHRTAWPPTLSSLNWSHLAFGTPCRTPAEAFLLSGPWGGWAQCIQGQRRKDTALV